MLCCVAHARPDTLAPRLHTPARSCEPAATRLCVRACARAAAGWPGRVLTCATALRLYEEGLFKLEDAVSDFIPSFGREWRVVLPREDARTATESVEYFAFLKGEKQTLHYSTHVPPRCARLPLASECRHSCLLGYFEVAQPVAGSDRWARATGQGLCFWRTQWAGARGLLRALVLKFAAKRPNVLAAGTTPAENTMRIKHLMSETSGTPPPRGRLKPRKRCHVAARSHALKSLKERAGRRAAGGRREPQWPPLARTRGTKPQGRREEPLHEETHRPIALLTTAAGVRCVASDAGRYPVRHVQRVRRVLRWRFAAPPGSRLSGCCTPPSSPQ